MAAAIQWRRLDAPGSESALLERTANGWRLGGAAVFLHAQRSCGLAYAIECSAGWQTRSVHVSGHIGADRCDLRIENEAGAWFVDNEERAGVRDCVDIDLGFSPATNLLPIRRLALEIGGSREVVAAWLEFPQMTLTPLVQVYTRETDRTYRYESPAHGFACTLETDRNGFVTIYPGLWQAEGAA